MKKYYKMLATMAAFLAVTVGALASPLYYTIFHALEEDTMEVFTAGGKGQLMVSQDGGDSYEAVSNFSFDGRGRGFAAIYKLNRLPGDALVKLTASFNEGENGQPVDTVMEGTVGEFFDSLMPYKRWSWLTYAPVYVSYESLPDIVEIAVNDGRFTTLVAAVKKAGLVDALTVGGDLTVFAPTDDAFATLLSELGITAGELLENPELGNILLYHVVGAALDSDAVSAETHIETLLGKDVEVKVVGEDLFINDSKVIIENIKASNGIIHVINAVLLPPTLQTIPEIAVDAGIFNTLVAALQKTGLDAALTNEGPFTVFAPTDDAFALLLGELGITPEELLENKDLANILLYHVVDGRLKAEDVVELERITTKMGKVLKVNVTDDGVFINDSKVVRTDIKAENGIIHVIDMVLIPESMPSIVEIAADAGNFQTLVSALQATGLDEALEGDGPFTVFAPTDEAFEKLPDWLLNFLVNNPKWLERILLYHVVAGDLQASEVIEEKYIKTLNGNSVVSKVKGEEVFINNAKVMSADIEASNGTIHVIDNVLLPWRRY